MAPYERQGILATNIDTAFLVTAADASFDAACLEQMLVMAHESGARPSSLLNYPFLN